MRISFNRIKLKLYKAFARHPTVSHALLSIGSLLYPLILVNYLLKAYPYFSFETLAGVVLGFSLYYLLSRKVDKLFGR